jgi:uncharacterized membrane protein YhiD involved in acid resistance
VLRTSLILATSVNLNRIERWPNNNKVIEISDLTMKKFRKRNNKRKTKTERTEETRKKQKENKLKDQFEEDRIFQKLTFKESEMVELYLVGLETNREMKTGNLPGHCWKFNKRWRDTGTQWGAWWIGKDISNKWDQLRR